MFKRNVMTVGSILPRELVLLFKEADEIRSADAAAKTGLVKWEPPLGAEGKIMATLFFEPSLRTRMSFESAMHRLGGKVVSAAGSDCTSCAKGESVRDAIGVASQYADVVVVRSSEDSSYLGEFQDAHIINAGDCLRHPTQAYIDAYTIWREYGTYSLLPIALEIGIAGDLAKSRAIRSFVELLSLSGNNDFYCYDSTGQDAKIPYDPPQDVIHYLSKREFTKKLLDLNVLYLNRVQTERHDKAPVNDFVLDGDIIHKLKSECLILNPGPRREELPPELDFNPRNMMMEQVKNGLYLRMALLRKLLG